MSIFIKIIEEGRNEQWYEIFDEVNHLEQHIILIIIDLLNEIKKNQEIDFEILNIRPKNTNKILGYREIKLFFAMHVLGLN